MHIAILTFEGFNEIDSLIALAILNRVRRPGWRVSIASPAAKVRSLNGVVMEAQASLEDACNADAVLVGSWDTNPGSRCRCRADVATPLRPDAPVVGRAMLGHARTRQAGPGERRSGLYGPVHQAMGSGGRRGCARSALCRQGKRCDRRRVPVVAVPGRLVHRPSGRCRGCTQRD
ncbi:hypothetical protein CNECB9_2320002 [Cupriavidus necator]|uniref:DJ-1/PfpI domain-containing protein n=1 Tax=Cupriavidus necator TaxID=106590 RepID=A0A1K0IDJ6_CUPNE|nr:hypothetical protein CNECB9_2320002 [Cupriavidus necator]